MSDPMIQKIQQRKTGIARFSAMQEVCEKAKQCHHCKAFHVASVSHSGSNRKDKETPVFGSLFVTFKQEKGKELITTIWMA